MQSSLTSIGRQLHADYLPTLAKPLPSELKGLIVRLERSIKVLQSAVAKPGPQSQSTRVSIGQQIIIGSRDTVAVFRPSNFAADVAFSAIGLGALVERWCRLKKWIFDPYRPELHYMRGPGPKWREKHSDGGSRRPMSHQQQDCTSAEQISATDARCDCDFA
jgi:hypothetical protein